MICTKKLQHLLNTVDTNFMIIVQPWRNLEQFYIATQTAEIQWVVDLDESQSYSMSY